MPDGRSTALKWLLGLLGVGGAGTAAYYGAPPLARRIGEEFGAGLGGRALEEFRAAPEYGLVFGEGEPTAQKVRERMERAGEAIAGGLRKGLKGPTLQRYLTPSATGALIGSALLGLPVIASGLTSERAERLPWLVRHPALALLMGGALGGLGGAGYEYLKSKGTA